MLGATSLQGAIPASIKRWSLTATGCAKKATTPDWEAQPLTPEKSVQLAFGVVKRPADSGKLLSQFDNQVWF